MSIQILLEDRINQLFIDNPELNSISANKFEIAVGFFCNLKHLHGIDHDDVLDGILGSGGDEGIDLCFSFCNGIPIKDSDHPINKDSIIKLKFFQVKKENGFSVDGFRKFKEGIQEIFDLTITEDGLRGLGANSDFIENAMLIRSIIRKANVNRAKISCEIFYVTNSLKKEIPAKIDNLLDNLKSTLSQFRIQLSHNFFNAQDLLDLTDLSHEKIEISFISQPLEVKDRNIAVSGYAGFIEGKKLIESLLDENKAFRSHLTEGNVRFFLGEDTKINSSIIETANDNKKSETFWAMNNGLTIIGDSISPLSSSDYSIENPQIVNGCQTVHCLYDAYKKQDNSLPESLKVFVKVVNTDNLDIQTDIISATNSQNQVKSASLKANDNIQRNIEQHLLKFGIKYERRENFYKRQGHSGNKVISLLKLGQIMHSVINKESVSALNDASTIFDSEQKYKSIFNDLSDYDIYKFSCLLYQKVWNLKNSDLRTNDYSPEIKSIISKSGFPILHLMSSIILSKSSFVENGVETFEPLTASIDLSNSSKSSPFQKRKKSAFAHLEDDSKMKDFYELSKKSLLISLENYSKDTKKEKISAFKYRKLDKDYLIPELLNHL